MDYTDELRILSGTELAQKTMLLWLSVAFGLTVTMYYFVFPNYRALVIFCIYPAINLLFYAGLRLYGKYHPERLKKQLWDEYSKNLMLIKLYESCADKVREIVNILTDRENVLFYHLSSLYIAQPPTMKNWDTNPLNTLSSKFSVEDEFFEVEKTHERLEQEFLCLQLKLESVQKIVSHDIPEDDFYIDCDIITRIGIRNFIKCPRNRWHKLSDIYRKGIELCSQRIVELRQILDITESPSQNMAPETEAVS